jgi:SAM-dependent methyltransferase
MQTQNTPPEHVFPSKFAGTAPSLCNQTLIDLGGRQDSRFAGILSPQSHLTANLNASQIYDFDKARLYHQRHYFPSGIEALLRRASTHFQINSQAPLALDIGSGSGNSVAAMLRVIDNVQVIATDVSPDLLAIMTESLRDEGLPVERVSPMCLDVHEAYFNNGAFDLVCGSAILHHLLDPRRAVTNALHALKPGGVAVFFEPFEYGCTILKLIHSRLLRESEMRSGGGPDSNPIGAEAAEFLRNVSHHLSIREGISGGVKPITAELDDKWLFTREFFEAIGADVGASKLIVYSNHTANSDTMFEDYVRQNFHLGKGWGREALPAWAWDTVREFDREVSDEMKLSFMIEGTIIFVK